MGTCLDDARWTTACVASLALGCLSTGEPLFRAEGAPPPAPQEMTPALPLSAAPVEPVLAPSAIVSVPEQLLGGARDDDPIAPNEGGETGEETAEAAVVPEPPPANEAVATDPCALDGAILCDTFDDLPDDAFPGGEGWLPELAGCGSHTIDGAGPSVSGTKALRAGDGGYPECMLHAELLDEDDVHVRTHVFLDAAGDLLSQYVSLLEFGSRAAQDDPELRIGVRPAEDNVCPGTPGVDVTGSGLAVGPGTTCTGFVLEPERWYCVETHFVRAGANLSLSVSIDGTPLLARDFALTDQWTEGDLYVKLGRASYGPSSTGSVWHDDVAVGRQLMPCEP